MEPEYRPLIPPKHKGGRPNRMRPDLIKRSAKPDPRSTLTPEVHKKIVDAIKVGAHENVAAQFAGINPQTMYGWLTIGRGAQGHFKKNERYALLAAEVDQARATSEFQAILHWRSAMGKDWHAAQKFLELSYPERWKPKSEAERMTNPNINITMQQGMINQGQQVEKRSLLQMIEDDPALFSPTMQAINAALSTIEGEYQEVSVESPQAGYNSTKPDEEWDVTSEITRWLPDSSDSTRMIEAKTAQDTFDEEEL